MPNHARGKWGAGVAATLAAILLVGCSVALPAASGTLPDSADVSTPGVQQPAGAQSASPAGDNDEDSSVQETSSGEVNAEVRTLATQETTFLTHIEDAIADLGEPDRHYYVEYATADGAMWQGERLNYASGDVYFLQQGDADGQSAVRVDVPPTFVSESVAGELPAAETSTGNPANVEVRFVRARLVDRDSGAWTFDVTVEHPDTGWDDYADGWHVETLDGRILGTRILLHPHENEQPFTRSLSNIIVPSGTTEIRIRPHDLVSGYGLATEPIQLGDATSGAWYEVVR